MFLFMIFVRILPALPAHELRKLWVEENGGMTGFLLAEFATARETGTPRARRPRPGRPAEDVL